MKIELRELREGSNPVRFTIPTETVGQIVRDVDELYGADGELVVDLDVQRFDMLLQLTGSVRAPIHFECARCLTERRRDLEIPIRWTLLPRESLGGDVSEKEEVELTSDDLDTSFYDNEEIDLGELAREAVLLAIDPAPRCDPEEGCAASEVLLEADPSPPTPADDPRWAPLKQLLAKQKN